MDDKQGEKRGIDAVENEGQASMLITFISQRQLMIRSKQVAARGSTRGIIGFRGSRSLRGRGGKRTQSVLLFIFSFCSSVDLY